MLLWIILNISHQVRLEVERVELILLVFIFVGRSWFEGQAGQRQGKQFFYHSDLNSSPSGQSYLHRDMMCPTEYDTT